MDKKLIKEIKGMTKKRLGGDVLHKILDYNMPFQRGQIIQGSLWSDSTCRDYVQVTRCAPDKVWVKDVVFDHLEEKWVDHPNPTNHKPGKTTRRKLEFLKPLSSSSKPGYWCFSISCMVYRARDYEVKYLGRPWSKAFGWDVKTYTGHQF